MFKKLMMGLLLTTSLLSQNIVGDFFKYSTAYASFSLNAPRYQDDRFAIIGGLSTGQLEISRDKRELKPDFQTSFGLRKIGRFQYEPKRGVKSAGRGGTWYDGSEQNANESATFGPVKGWEYLVKLSEGRQWGNDYVNREFWLRYIGDYLMAKVGVTELGLEDIKYTQGDVRLHLTPEALNDKFHLSVGVKHRQHPVYGFDAMVLDTTWYRGEWWKFAEKAFGIDDNAWFTQEYYENGDLDVQLYELDPETGELRPIEGGGPFWNDDGRFVGVDWLWRDVDGRIFAYTDREYFFNDDGSGNIRLYYLVSGVKTYENNTWGTVNYATGEIKIASAIISAVSNVDGATSTKIRVTAKPSSNDVAPVRGQILSIDISNSTVIGQVDTIASGSGSSGVGYTTTTSY